MNAHKTNLRIFFTVPIFVFTWLFDEFQLENEIVAPIDKQQWDFVHKMGERQRKSLRNVTWVVPPLKLMKQYIIILTQARIQGDHGRQLALWAQLWGNSFFSCIRNYNIVYLFFFLCLWYKYSIDYLWFFLKFIV